MTDDSAIDVKGETWIARGAPTVSVVLPVFDPEISDLTRAVRSVEAQSWPFVELCIVDDGSRDPKLHAVLDEIATHRGVVFERLETNRGIAHATNAGVSLARGEYVALLDHDDELETRAVTEIVQPLFEQPDLDLVYSDHDLVDDEGRRIGVDIKPAWSPELLLSYMYIGHLKLIRRNRFLALGGYRENFPGAADYDFLLRLAEQSDRIQHVPKVLYHWRAARRSIARSSDTKPYAFESGLRALRDATERRGLAGQAEWPTWAQRARVGMYTVDFSDNSPAPFDVVVRVTDGTEALRGVFASIRECSRSQPATILLVDPQGVPLADDPTLDLESARWRHVSSLGESLEAARSEFVLVLDDQLRISEPHSLAQMIGFCGIPGVSAVGAKVITEAGLIDHAGMLLGVQGGVASAFRAHPDRLGPLEHGGYAHVSRNCAALATHALLIKRDIALEVGAFSDAAIAPALQGADCVLRMRRAGYRAAFVPGAEFVRPDLERSASVRELVEFRGRWGPVVDDDPFFHPLFSRVEADFRFRSKVDERDDFRHPELRPADSSGAPKPDFASLLTGHGLESTAPGRVPSRPLSRVLGSPRFQRLRRVPAFGWAFHRFRATPASARFLAALRALRVVD